MLGGILGDDGYRRLLATYRDERGLPDDTAAMVAAMSDERYGIPTSASPTRRRATASCTATASTSRPRLSVPDGRRARHRVLDGVADRARHPRHRLAAQEGARGAAAHRRGHPPGVGGVRTGRGAGGGGVPEWPAYDTERRPVLVFGDRTRVEWDPGAPNAWRGDAVWPSGTWFPIL
ncbi:hypothetical protein NKH77_06555 [Streptomyces sp. M19]